MPRGGQADDFETTGFRALRDGADLFVRDGREGRRMLGAPQCESVLDLSRRRTRRPAWGVLLYLDAAR